MAGEWESMKFSPWCMWSSCFPWIFAEKSFSKEVEAINKSGWEQTDVALTRMSTCSQLLSHPSLQPLHASRPYLNLLSDGRKVLTFGTC